MICQLLSLYLNINYKIKAMTQNEKLKLQKLEAKLYLTYRRYVYIGMDELHIERANARWFAIFEYMLDCGINQDLKLPDHDEAFDLFLISKTNEKV